MFSIQTNSSEIKKFLGSFATPLLVGTVLSTFAFAGWYAISAWKEFRRDPQQIVITGEGKMAVKPDVAVFTSGVVSQAKKIGDAQLDNTRRSNAVLGFLKQQEIEEKDIKTVNYSIYPQYEYYSSRPCPLYEGGLSYPCPPQKPPEISSYEVRHTIEVRVRDLEKVDDLLDGVVKNGANEVGSISFRVDDEERVQAEARKYAIDDAREKAKILSKDLGVRLGKVVGFSESGGGFPIYMRSLEAKGGFGGDVAPTPAVEPGEQEIQSFVTITYEFR